MIAGVACGLSDARLEGRGRRARIPMSPEPGIDVADVLVARGSAMGTRHVG
jgi:hypothetical protein